MIGPEVTFINEAVLKYRIRKFLEKELERYGFSDVDIQRTPMVTRIAIRLQNPSSVSGRKSYKLSYVTKVLREEFGINDPQISVVSVPNPSLDAMVIARKAVKSIEMGKPIRGVLHKLVEEVMLAGAQGVEIQASGKIVGKGGRAKTLRVSAGYVPKVGDVMYYVNKALQVAYPKSGAIGVYVVIIPPDLEMPDKQKKPVVPPVSVITTDEVKRIVESVEVEVMSESAIPKKGVEAEDVDSEPVDFESDGKSQISSDVSKTHKKNRTSSLRRESSGTDLAGANSKNSLESDKEESS